MHDKTRTSIGHSIVNSIPQPVWHYGIATFAVLLGLLLRTLFIPLLGERAPFTFFWLAIVAAGIVGGFRPGIYATALSSVFAFIFFLPPWLILFTEQTEILFGFVLFVVQGSVLSIVTGKLRTANHRSRSELAKRAGAEQQLRVQHALGAAITDAQSFDIGIPRMLETVVQGFGWQLGQWWQVEPRTQTLHYTTSYHANTLAPNNVRAFENSNRKLTIGPGLGVLGAAWQQRTVLCYEPGDSLVATTYETTAASLGLQQSYALPIVSAVGVVGVMVFWSDRRATNEGTVDLLGMLGRQIGQFYDRNRTAAEAHTSEARKSAILSAALDAIITIDHSGIVREWNPAASAMFDYPATYAIGTLLSELIIPHPMREAHQRGMKHYLNTGEGSVLGKMLELDAMRADGSMFPIELSIIRLPTDGPPMFSGFIRDLSRRKEAQSALHFQAQLLDSVEEAVIATDVHGTITYWNRFAQTLYGWTAADVIGRNVVDIIVPPRARTRSRRLLAWLAKGESWSGEWRMTRRDGTTFPAILTNAPVYYERGELVGLVGITRDISERKRIEDSNRFLASASVLLSSSLDEHAILEQLTQLAVPRLGEWCAIDMLQADGMIRRVALAHADATKQTLSWEIERRFGTSNTDPEGPARVLREGRSILYRDIPLMSLAQVANDSDHYVMLQKLALRSIISVPLIARGHTLGAVSLGNSDTRHRFDESDLRLFEDLALRAGLAIDNARLHQETQSAVHQRDEFLSVAAHELKTPVTSVLAYSQVLSMHAPRNAALDARAQRAIQTINGQTERLSRLISSLLDVSRLSSGHFALDLERLDVRELLARIAYEIEPTLDSHVITFVAPPDPIFLLGDAQRLEQMFQNLLQNAIKYSPRGGDIALRLSVAEGFARIEIEDNGLGIPRVALPHIFDRFYRVPNNNQPVTAGMGVGLYVVNEIANRHDGRIDVVSVEGQGTTFTVCLPLDTATLLNPPVPVIVTHVA